MAPVIRELRGRVASDSSFETLVLVTAQHRELLDQVLDLFDIRPDADLDAMRPGQDLAELTARLIEGTDRLLARFSPDLVLVHGDTTTALAASLAACYRQIPVGHVEAGLRTGNPLSPFPEETNRRLIDTLSLHHFAPTERASANLLREGMDQSRIVVSGNTAVDALRLVLDRSHRHGNQEIRQRAPAVARILDEYKRIVLVTSHRRENFGEGLKSICAAILELTYRFDDLAVVFSVHPNPAVRTAVTSMLEDRERIFLTEPLDYGVFCHLMAASHLILTDSGGIQEEAPSLGKPVLVLRETSERPEGVEAGAARLVGTRPREICEAVAELLEDREAYARMAAASNPYGDGRAAERIVCYLCGCGKAGCLPDVQIAGSERGSRRTLARGCLRL